jgi:hypothetical protein
VFIDSRRAESLSAKERMKELGPTWPSAVKPRSSPKSPMADSLRYELLVKLKSKRSMNCTHLSLQGAVSCTCSPHGRLVQSAFSQSTCYLPVFSLLLRLRCNCTKAQIIVNSPSFQPRLLSQFARFNRAWSIRSSKASPSLACASTSVCISEPL